MENLKTRTTTTSNPMHPLPSFFKILLDDSNPRPLPPAFVKKQFLDGEFPENPVLKTEFGGKWKVEIEKIRGKFCFVNGWLQFVEDTKTEVRDFLVFWLIGKSTFKVSIFGPNACAKDLRFATPANYKCSCNCSGSGNSDTGLKNVIKIEEDDDDVDEDEAMDEVKNDYHFKEEDIDEDDTDSDDDEDDYSDEDELKEIKVQQFVWNEQCLISSFEKVLTKSHSLAMDGELQRFECKEKSQKPCFQKVLAAFNAYYMELPKQFILESGLGNSRNIILRNTAGREWPVKVKISNRSSRAYISRGWVNFRRVNKLMDGDTCSFQYFNGDQASQSDFIQVEVVKKAARERGRPPRIRPGERSRITVADLKNAIKLEEDDGGDTNVEELDDDDHEVNENDIELQPFEQKDKSIKPCFQKVLTTSNAYYLELPRWFVIQSGLRNERKTILRSKAGRYWPVALKTWSGRVFISRGWVSFRTVNKLMEGDTYSIQYIHGDRAGQSGFIQVKVVKKAARNRGGPPRIRPGKI